MTIVYDKLMALHLEPAIQVHAARGIALRCARTQHGNADRDHYKRKQNKSLSPATSLSIEESIAAHGHFHYLRANGRSDCRRH